MYLSKTKGLASAFLLVSLDSQCDGAANDFDV